MVSACLEINTTRDIGRQILRHRSFSFQEFSQRYADVVALGGSGPRECRMQDSKNRQNSLETDDAPLHEWWRQAQLGVSEMAAELYSAALHRGIAKEQARALLPEGLTPSRMYMAGTMRSWMHWIQVRTDPSTQKEHRLLAEEAKAVLAEPFPIIMGCVPPLSQP
jgi:thymidylate synthase (FAD)